MQPQMSPLKVVSQHLQIPNGLVWLLPSCFGIVSMICRQPYTLINPDRQAAMDQVLLPPPMLSQPVCVPVLAGTAMQTRLHVLPM